VERLQAHKQELLAELVQARTTVQAAREDGRKAVEQAVQAARVTAAEMARVREKGRRLPHPPKLGCRCEEPRVVWPPLPL